MSGIIALESYAKERGGGSDSAVPLKCCTKSRAIGFGCATAPLAGYSDNQLVKVSDIETGVYVTELKVYHHRGTETDNTFDNYEEITEFVHGNMFHDDQSSYKDEFVVEAVDSKGTHVNVSHLVGVYRINGATPGLVESTLDDGTASVIVNTSKSVTNGFQYRFYYGSVNKVIDGWLYRTKLQRLEIGNQGSNPYSVNPTNPYDSNAVYVDLSMRIEGNEEGPDNGYGYSSSVFQVLGNYTVDGRYLVGGSNYRFNIGSSNYFPVNLEYLGPNYRTFRIYSTTFTNYNNTGGNDKIIESDVDVTIKLGDIAYSTVIDNNSLTRTNYTLRSPSSPL